MGRGERRLGSRGGESSTQFGGGGQRGGTHHLTYKQLRKEILDVKMGIILENIFRMEVFWKKQQNFLNVCK